MHPHHKLALLKARANLRKAKMCMELSRNAYEYARKVYLFRLGASPFWGAWVRAQYGVVSSALLQYRVDVDAYIAAGEILVCVERLLAKA